jgi:hypothetical protein
MLYTKFAGSLMNMASWRYSVAMVHFVTVAKTAD